MRPCSLVGKCGARTTFQGGISKAHVLCHNSSSVMKTKSSCHLTLVNFYLDCDDRDFYTDIGSGPYLSHSETKYITESCRPVTLIQERNVRHSLRTISCGEREGPILFWSCWIVYLMGFEGWKPWYLCPPDLKTTATDH